MTHWYPRTNVMVGYLAGDFHICLLVPAGNWHLCRMWNGLRISVSMKSSNVWRFLLFLYIHQVQVQFVPIATMPKWTPVAVNLRVRYVVELPFKRHRRRLWTWCLWPKQLQVVFHHGSGPEIKVLVRRVVFVWTCRKNVSFFNVADKRGLLTSNKRSATGRSRRRFQWRPGLPLRSFISAAGFQTPTVLGVRGWGKKISQKRPFLP